MSNLAADRVTLIEVAPRDGFQSVLPLIPLADKLALIEALAGAGLKHIEVGAFVHPKAIPQMADISQILEITHTATTYESMVLVPNEKGAKLAQQHHCQRINFVLSVSEQHNLSNVRKTLAESLIELEKVQRVVEASPGMSLRVSLATSFDCPFSGKVDAQDCLNTLDQVLKICPDAQIALCDTTGRAHPFALQSLFSTALTKVSKSTVLIFHGHDTYGMGIANVAAAYRAGVRFFDTAVAGFGGCPFAPGASGNVATEDVLYFFSSAGIETSINSEKLQLAISLAEKINGAQLGGSIRLLNRQ